MRHIHAYFLQPGKHSLPIGICAYRADRRTSDPPAAQMDNSVDTIARRIGQVQILIAVDTAKTDGCNTYHIRYPPKFIIYRLISNDTAYSHSCQSGSHQISVFYFNILSQFFVDNFFNILYPVYIILIHYIIRW